MEWILIASAVIEILKYIDSQKKNKPKKVTSKQVKAIAATVGGKTKKTIDKAEALGILPNALWVINNWLGLK